jgi:hypothetical protein
MFCVHNIEARMLYAVRFKSIHTAHERQPIELALSYIGIKIALLEINIFLVTAQREQ